MFLINPIIWMFKTEYFKRHFLYMCMTGLICWGLAAVICMFLTTSILANANFVVNTVLLILAVVLVIIPFLCQSGYFWCLTDNVINRELLVKANSIYNGKTEFINKITLPEWDTARFVWRGIASIFAYIIMYIPLAILMFLFFFNIAAISQFWQFNPAQVMFLGIGAYVMFCLIIPALLWNYARRDSVVAVLNLPKAIYIITSYPGKYILNTILFIVFYIVHSFAIKLIALLFGIASIPIAYTGKITGYDLSLLSDIFSATSTIILLVISYVVATYWNYVYAYLLGTIAPPSEA